MTLMIEAIYENGVLRPHVPLNLPDKARVAIQINDKEDDPFMSLVGAFASEQPLIDDIPVSADPDLYLAATELGTAARDLHAWEIAPARYQRGDDGKPVRIDAPTPA